jgi:beta-phosphoglucomutase-like phosphatase (HAD superfamily)
VIGTAEELRFAKPDPEVYLEAAQQIGERPAACVVFEDALVGVQVARRTGMRTIGGTLAHTADDRRAAGAEATNPDFQGLDWNTVVRP